MADEKIRIEGRYRPMIQAAVGRLHSDVEHVNQQLQSALGPSQPVPKANQAIAGRLKGLSDALHQGSPIGAHCDLPLWFAEVLKTALVRERRQVAKQAQVQRRRAVSPEVIADLEARLSPFDELAAQDWYQEAKLLAIPRIDDFLSKEYLKGASHVNPGSEGVKKQFDPKSGILFSAQQLVLDMPSLRTECEQRGVPLAIVFLDLDNFKSLNTKYGEPVVDRDLLPPLMQVFEGAFFGHGTCYRYGGDEFVVLIPNGVEAVLAALLHTWAGRLADCEYTGIAERPTASVGVCELGPDAAVTDEEAITLAASAKQAAKDAGRGQVMGVRVSDIIATDPAPWLGSRTGRSITPDVATET